MEAIARTHNNLAMYIHIFYAYIMTVFKYSDERIRSDYYD